MATGVALAGLVPGSVSYSPPSRPAPLEAGFSCRVVYGTGGGGRMSPDPQTLAGTADYTNGIATRSWIYDCRFNIVQVSLMFLSLNYTNGEALTPTSVLLQGHVWPVERAPAKKHVPDQCFNGCLPDQTDEEQLFYYLGGDSAK